MCEPSLSRPISVKTLLLLNTFSQIGQTIVDTDESRGRGRGGGEDWREREGERERPLFRTDRGFPLHLNIYYPTHSFFSIYDSLAEIYD